MTLGKTGVLPKKKKGRLKKTMNPFFRFQMEDSKCVLEGSPAPTMQNLQHIPHFSKKGILWIWGGYWASFGLQGMILRPDGEAVIRNFPNVLSRFY